MGNEMGNNNTTGVLQESDDATTEVQEKSLQQPVRNDDKEGENHAVPASENVNIDEKETVLASNDSNGTGHDRVPDKSSNEGELNVKKTDNPTANHENDKSVGEAVNDEDSEIQSDSFAKELEEHEKPTEPVSASDENNSEISHDKLQKQVSFSKDGANSEAQEKSLQKSVPENDAKGESYVVPASENKNNVGEETVLPSIDSNGIGDDHARGVVSAAEEPNVTKADLPIENNKTEIKIDEDSEIKSTSGAKESEDHEKSTERVPVSNEDHLETNYQLQKQASFGKAEEDEMLIESCVTTSALQNSESQVLMETNFEESKLTEIHANQSEQVSRNSEIKLDGDLGSIIENNPVNENGQHIETCSTNMDETIVSVTDLVVEEKKEELSVTKMTSQKSEMQFEEKSEGNEGEFMSTTIISLNSASDDAEKCDGKSIGEVKSQENNRLELHQEVMANSENSSVEDFPEDKCMVLTEETKLVKKDSETEGNKQYQNNAQSNDQLVMQSSIDETNVLHTEFLLNPDGKSKEKNEPDSNSCDPSGNKDFQKQENVAEPGYCIEDSEDNSRESEGENVTDVGMLPPELCIPCQGENADEAKVEEQEEIKHKLEAASLNDKEIEKSENTEYLKFQSLPVHSEPSHAFLIHCQDFQQETAVLSNGFQSSSNSTLDLKSENCSELPDTKPTIFHGRSLTVDFLGSAIEIALEKPMPVAVNSVSANPEMVLETKSSSASHQSIDRYDVEASLQAKDNFAEAAESVARSSTESNPNGFNAQMRKSPSFSLDLREEERRGESDRTPLLYQDRTTTKSSQSDATAQNHCENQTKEVEEKVITLERSDSEKSRTPFLGFLKQDEEDHIAVTPKKQENQAAAKNSITKEVSSTTSKLKEKHNKRRSSLFTNCMCCTTVIN